MLVRVQAHTQEQQQDSPKYGGTLIEGVTGGWELSTLTPTNSSTFLFLSFCLNY